MKHHEPGELRAGWASLPNTHPTNLWAVIGDFIYKTLVIAELEMRKLRHEPAELITRAFQPVLWFVVFGQVFSRVRAIPTGDLPYIAFLAPGILAQSVLFVAIFCGISTIWERDLGTIHRFIASPTPRAALVLGKALSAGARCVSPAVIIFVLAFALGVQMNFSPLAIIGALATIFLGAIVFATFSLIIACLVRTRARFMGIGQALAMPLFFASNAIYPISMMPEWLQFISQMNPLTYVVDALRALMIANASSVYGVGIDLGILIVTATLLVVLAGRVYPTIVS